MLSSLQLSLPLLSNRFICRCYSRQATNVEFSKYKEAFSRRMAMAGLKPHHKIALGVSGGPDSIALCVLTAGWKTDALIGADERNGCIDGLLAIIVDHGLRKESKAEANSVRNRVSEMGIRCEIATCDWLSGKPKQGHLQEAARDMRYQIFQNVCVENNIGVLFVAHHADDQAELFILRLSRNSGVLGLAGMAFTSQLFPKHMLYYGENSGSPGILLVRPLLEFSKEDLYKICQRGNQEWVEDPTNQSVLFARNRIRMSLGNLPSCIFRSEMQAVISACRKSRSFVDKRCADLINQTVTITSHGYAIIDLVKLDPSNVEDICLSKFIALVVQFISQRHRPVRGRTSKLLLDYIRKLPCKNSLTAAACYLCAAPQSKGTKILICYSHDSPQPSKMEFSQNYYLEEKKYSTASELHQILSDGKSYSDCLVPDASNVPFSHTMQSESILSEAKRLGIISESTYENILLLQKEETKQFNARTEVTTEHEARHEISTLQRRHEISSADISMSEPLRIGRPYHFMNRFLVMLRFQKTIDNTVPLKEIDSSWNSECANEDYLCESCAVGHDVAVRHMVDADWLYLTRLSKDQTSEPCQGHNILSDCKDQQMDKRISCSDYARLSAQRALQALKSIPLAARRGLPVLVNSQGLILSIPNIDFKHCRHLSVSATFMPRVPLGGGHSSFI